VDDEKLETLEVQLKEAKYISEDADHKYDEVTAWVGCLLCMPSSPLFCSLATPRHIGWLTAGDVTARARSTLGPLPASCPCPLCHRHLTFQSSPGSRHTRPEPNCYICRHYCCLTTVINVYILCSFRGRKVLENRNINDDERIQQLEKELEETILLGEEADRKYDEVTA